MLNNTVIIALWNHYNARIDDTLVAHAIVTGLLPRENTPAELLEALQPIIAFYEREQVEPEQEADRTAAPSRRGTTRYGSPWRARQATSPGPGFWGRFLR